MSDELMEPVQPEIVSPQEEMQAIFASAGEAISNSMHKAVQRLNEETQLNNVAIFVDYDNVYWTLMNDYAHDPDHPDTRKNLFEQLWRRYGRDHIRSFRAYADFQRVRTSLTSLQKKRVQIRHVYSNDKNGDTRKNASDIEMCIDAIESTYKDSTIGLYVFVTADSDIIPVLSRMMYKGKRVELLYLSTSAPQHVDITAYAHESMDLLEFLNVERQQFDVDAFIQDSLRFIYDWENTHGSNLNVWLGQGWLRDQLSSKFGVPANIASQVIERLLVEEAIASVSRQTNQGRKPSLQLTEKGRKFLQPVFLEAAAEDKHDISG